MLTHTRHCFYMPLIANYCYCFVSMCLTRAVMSGCVLQDQYLFCYTAALEALETLKKV